MPIDSKVQRNLGLALVILGLAALVLGTWAGSQFRTLTARRPYFSHPFSIAVATTGELLVGVGNDRVHIYAPDGEPVLGWRIPADGARSRLESTPEGSLLVAPEGRGELLEYDLEGNLLGSRPDAEAFDRIGPARDVRIETPDGIVFELRERGIWRLENGGERPIVPGPSPPLSLLGPEPVFTVTISMLSGVLGILGGVVLASSGTRPSRVHPVPIREGRSD